MKLTEGSGSKARGGNTTETEEDADYLHRGRLEQCGQS